MAPQKHEFIQATLDEANLVHAANIEVLLNTEATFEIIKKINPDEVVIATGAGPLVVPIAGADMPHVSNAHKVLGQKSFPKGKVVIVGGGIVGVEVAEYLTSQGLNCTIIEMKGMVAGDLGYYRMMLSQQYLADNNVQCIVNAACKEITAKHVTYVQNEVEHEVECDNISSISDGLLGLNMLRYKTEMIIMYEEIKVAAGQAMTELMEKGKFRSGNIVAVGCSSSEIMGVNIGKGSTPDAAKAVVEGIMPVIEAHGGLLAAQCCEHLNRALVVERTTAEKFGYDVVCVRPRPKAGGSFATAVYEYFKDPVVVEHVRATAGLDIGNTMIGMHMKDVAVPLRLETRRIGEAWVNAAYSRPKLIGGSRADYPD